MRLVRRFVAIAALVVLGVVFLSWGHAFVGQVVRVEGVAMAPTLEHGDFVFVNKLAYRMNRPSRDDVVMHLYPIDPRRAFVKRLIAEAGDTVRIAEGTVFVNDRPRADTQVPAPFRSYDHWGPQVVPEGYCFVMGDHRNNSSDSRHWGFVPVQYVLGRVSYRLTGPNRFTAVR